MIVNRKSLYYLRLFLDLILLNAAFLLAAVSNQSFELLLIRSHMFILLAINNFLWYFVANVINFYDDFYSQYFLYQFVNVLKSAIVQFLAAITFLFFVKEPSFTRNYMLLYAILLIVFISGRILVLRFILSKRKGSERRRRNAVVVGTGELGKNFFNIINEHNEFGYNMMGFLSQSDEPDDLVLGKIQNIDEIISGNRIETAFIALPMDEWVLLEEVIRICNKNAVKTYIIPDYSRFVSKKFQISMIGNFPVIAVRNEPLDEYNWRLLKRSFDILFSFILIVLVLWWAIPLIALIIKIDSKGPSIFKQERIGVKNRKFRCYKFRTMSIEEAKKSRFVPVVKGDPRITKVGKFLRSTNLDEIPQFFNVLKGDMSIVGPRPHPFPHNERYTEMYEAIKLRLNVKPGLTGWAQIHGLRGDVEDSELNKKRTIKRIEYDIWYIENWSFWLDLQIILVTVWQMIKGDTRGV